MGRQTFAAVSFPLLLIGLLMAERIATFFLGLHPSSMALWAASVELRALCRVITNWLELATGGHLILQTILIAVVAIAIWQLARTRHGSAVSFVVNHGALLTVGAATMLANGASFASVDPVASAPLSFVPFQSLHVGWLHGVVFAIGLMGCLSCHYSYLDKARGRERAVKARLTELSLGLEGRR
jgi:nitrate/nitrite transporter NarK